MNSSTRLYERLGQIPQDPEDPESLEDLVVCAFGAFERYYVCWKEKSGEYKQDGYDLPPTLKDWLFPADGTTRDFASLQVVFGRGDEYFASDKDGKLEMKEPEIKKPPPPTEGEDLPEKPIMRRSRTISFLRPLSDPAPKFNDPPKEMMSRKDSVHGSTRSSSVSSTSQPSSWDPSTPISRPTSDPFIIPLNTTLEHQTKESPIASPVPTPLPTPIRQASTRRPRPLSMSFTSSSFPKIPEGKPLLSQDTSPAPSQDPTHCTCGYHASNSTPPLSKRSTYTDSSMQTDPMTPPPRTALRIDTTTSDTSSLFYSNTSSALDLETPLTDDLPLPNPVYMGRMMDYYSKPGYQLGDGLFSSYSAYQQPLYDPYYQEAFGEEDAWGDVGRDGGQMV